MIVARPLAPTTHPARQQRPGAALIGDTPVLHAAGRASPLPRQLLPSQSPMFGTRRAVAPVEAQSRPTVNFLDAVPVSEKGPQATSSTTWSITLLTSKRSYLSGPVGLSIKVVGEDGTQHGQVTLSSGTQGWTEKAWVRSNDLGGTQHTGDVPLPAGIKPAAVILEHVYEQGSDVNKLKTLISSFTFSAEGQGSVTFPSDAYLAAQPRIFFAGTPLLPSQTPAGLLKLRQEELKLLQGLDNPSYASGTRKGDDRIYDYQPYNDLGDAEANERPILGGSAEFPYPRRIRTGRPNIKLGDRETPYEEAPTIRRPVLPVPWMPMDDDFDTEKNVGFLGNAVTAFLPSLQLLKDRRKDFLNIQEVLSLFDNDNGQLEPALRRSRVIDAINLFYKLQRGFISKFRKLRKDGRTVGDAVLDLFKPYDDLDDIFEYTAPYNIADVKAAAKRAGVEPPPVTARVDVWRTDEEFGRQYLAGINPMVLRAMGKGVGLPAASRITEADLTPYLEGHSVAELLAADKPRLFYVDYHTVIIDYLEIVNGTYGEGKKVQHAGHCVLYRRNDGYLVPIAIDLTSDKDKPLTVYTPAAPGAVWTLAKAIFSSIDAGYHQLISHWLRTHACQEPYLIATRRCLSTMHPVHKLILPHFRYTMPINANARISLINAGGVVEETFTPGKFCMRLSATVYGAMWHFATEALPEDLKLRGFLKADEGELLLDDYPYAEDGMLIWNAIEKYFTNYINLYYKSDQEVADDPEIQAWWTDIRTKGHGDKANDPTWPVLNTRKNLVRALATMAWVGSGHHAAVNFGQYDYAAFMPSRSSMIRKAMPEAGSTQYKELAMAAGATADSLLLSYQADPTAASKVTTTVKALVVHAKDEQYLSDPRQEYLTDAAAIELHKDFVEDIVRSEQIIAERNRDPARITRSLAAKGLPYRYMIASSEEGATGQGVPYSISI